MKKILQSQSGMGLIVPIIIVGLIIFTFSANIAKMYVVLNENNQKLLRGIAAIQVMQDFAVLGLQANDLSISSLSVGVCAGGTTLIPPLGPNGFCWRNPSCVAHPMHNRDADADGDGDRQICLTPVVGAAGDASLVLNITPPKEPTFFVKLKDHSYQLLKNILNVSSNEAIAQIAGRDIELPNIADNPVNAVTTNLNCAAAGGVGTQLCKRCDGATQNVLCTQIRVCLLGVACDPAVADNWVFERFGITR